MSKGWSWHFAQYIRIPRKWRDTPSVNLPIPLTLAFTETTPGTFTSDNSAFFPIDGQGFGNGPGGNAHNFLFTTEIHSAFTYEGGEVFTFRGDDDLWVFVNKTLAIDLGGPHPSQAMSISMDALAPKLGIVVGTTYAMEIFHAERHTDQSNFHIETTIRCFTPGDVH